MLQNSYHITSSNPKELAIHVAALWNHWKSKAPHQRIDLIIPHTVQGGIWKKTLLQQNISLFGARILTPSQLRRELLRELLPDLPAILGREEMLFLLEEAIHNISSTDPFIQALGLDARPLLNTLDELHNAGHDLEDFTAITQHPALREIATQWTPIAKLFSDSIRIYRDNQLLSTAQQRPNLLSRHLILAGLDVRQSGFKSVLESALLLYQAHAIFSIEPQHEEISIQQSWRDWLDQQSPNAYDSLPVDVPEQHPMTPQLFIDEASSRIDEAHRVIHHLRSWLPTLSPWETIGIIFPGPTPLHHLLADHLQECDIPFCSEFPIPLGLEPSSALLQAWLNLQLEGARSDLFIQYWKQKSKAQPTLAPSWKEIENQLHQQTREIPDAHLATLINTSSPEPLRQWIHQWHAVWQWPKQGLLSEYRQLFLNQCNDPLDLPIDDPLIERVNAAMLRLENRWSNPISRQVVIRFMDRLLAGSHNIHTGNALAPVALLSPETAASTPLNSAIIVQLNESDWPGDLAPSTLLEESHRIILNKKSQLPSPTSLGDFCYRHGFSPLLSDADRYSLLRAQFHSLKEFPCENIIFSSARWDDLEAHRELFPSEFFRDAQSLPGVSRASFNFTESQTAPRIESNLLQHLSSIHQQRGNPNTSFDEFQFRLNTAPPSPIPFRVREVEKLWMDPASAWFETLLQLPSPEISWDTESLLPMFSGSLLHEWMQQSLQIAPTSNEIAWTKIPASPEITLDSLINQKQTSLEKRYQIANVPLPAWWQSEWARLSTKARLLLTQLLPLLKERRDWHLSTEFSWRQKNPWTLSHEILIPPLFGRADLILVQGTSIEDSKEIVIIDFKTGNSAEPFEIKPLKETGKYGQLLAYAALVMSRNGGPLNVSVAIVTPHPESNASVTMLDPLEFQHLWHALHQASFHGIFGQKLGLHNRFESTSKLPLASLEIPPSLLKQKWEKTLELATS